MTLLKYLRYELALSRDQMIRIIVRRRSPFTDWNANEIQIFCDRLTEYGRKAEQLATDVKSNSDIDNCHDCGIATFYNDMHSCYQGDFYVCENCVESYAYSDYQDTYINYDDNDEEKYE